MFRGKRFSLRLVPSFRIFFVVVYFAFRWISCLEILMWTFKVMGNVQRKYWKILNIYKKTTPFPTQSVLHSPQVSLLILLSCYQSKAHFSVRLTDFLPISGVLLSSKPCGHRVHSTEILFLFVFWKGCSQCDCKMTNSLLTLWNIRNHLDNK